MLRETILKIRYSGWLMKQDIRKTRAMALPFCDASRVERQPMKMVWTQMNPRTCHFSWPILAQMTQTEMRDTAAGQQSYGHQKRPPELTPGPENGEICI